MKRLEQLANDAIALCKERGWSRTWEGGGVYLHLEVSEFIEALRGKRGEPYREAGDILFVLLSVVRYYNIDLEQIVDYIENKIVEIRDSGYTGGYIPEE